MMRQQFHSILKSTAVGLPLSFFSIIYVKATIHAYHEHLEHQEKMKLIANETDFQAHESSAWTRFRNTYLPLFPIMPQSKPILEQSQFEQTSSKKPK